MKCLKVFVPTYLLLKVDFSYAARFMLLFIVKWLQCDSYVTIGQPCEVTAVIILFGAELL